jgi:oxygen-independent coproporphyrinogen-3 oxidase
MKPGVYVHIPFCEQRCHYCAFAVAVAPQDAHEPYVRRLVREIELSGFVDVPETIFFGGGTPSIVDARLIEEILKALPAAAAQGRAAAAEISVETNPGTLSPEKLEHYRALGVNRISLGAQSFHDEDLKIAGRLHTAADVFEDIESLRKHEFNNVNIDLIAGLPGQQFSLWSDNLKMIETLRPEHVSIYMLDREEHSAWSKHTSAFEDDELFARFYREAAERLQAAGYVHYEISNWALAGFECRHNLKYWTGAPYRGFGVSAHSYANDTRFWNTSSLTEYADLVDSGALPAAGREALTPEMQLEEAFLLGLRQLAGFDIRRIASKLGFEYSSQWLDRVCELEDDGWIQFDGRFLRLTPAGWLLANTITEELIWPKLLSTSEATP